jgi:hypothetical protein
MTHEYPPQVQGFHDVLARVPGVVRVDTSVTGLEGIGLDELALPELADLPHAVLRRAGGQRGEVVVQVEFEVEQSAAGWRGLEFIAWAIKDLSRSGELVQLRPTALPPIAHESIQLGQTLRFLIDVFVHLDGDIAAALDKLARLAGYFDRYLSLYSTALYPRSNA